MNVEAVNVALSLATLLVVGAASVAAVATAPLAREQSAQRVLLEIMNQWNIPAVQVALAAVRAIPEKIKDPEYVRMLNAPGSADRSRYSEFLALDLWDKSARSANTGSSMKS